MKSTSFAGTSHLKSSATGTLHLVPEPVESRAGPSSKSSTSNPDAQKKIQQRTTHTHAEIWKWTLAKHAIAPCRVEDIYKMQECDSVKPSCDPDYFWIGNVPCRSVSICGMVVGVQVYEQRAVYTIDDGSGKIDCNLRESDTKPKAHTSPKRPAASSSKTVPSILMTLPITPKPIAAVGDIVRVVGRVLQRRNSRILNLDRLTLCQNATDEPLHWLTVLNLHSTWYSSVSTSPFVIPPPPVSATANSRRGSISTSEKEDNAMSGRRMLPPISPSKLSVTSSAPSSPSSSTSGSIGGSSHHGPMSPPRLRHPSRLHTRDLTANTFRIYVKHYMDNAPPDHTSLSSKFSAGLVSNFSEDESEEDGWEGQEEPVTPTKPRHRANQENQYEVDLTPMPRKVGRSNATLRKSDITESDNGDIDGDGSGLRGYTLSHLRRVPELAMLARRVVETEYKRRAKEQRKKLKEAQQGSSSFSASSVPHRSGTTPTTIKSTSIALGKGNESEPISAKMKRLFRYAIRQLYQEGSIVMWDGSVRRLPQPMVRIPRPSFTSNAECIEDVINRGIPPPQSASQLWKTSTSMSTAGYTTRSTTLGSVSQYVTEDDIEYLSDPPPAEESYIPLTAPYLAKVLEQAIVEIISRSQQAKSRPHSFSKKGPPQPGPTVDEIVRYFHRKDERWARVGEWAVKEALEWANEQGRMWCVGDGRWEVCG
ncbi:hypothetical protein BDY19DRAFT_939543 [Irpex rosettiformis]|uniref:Uncharacterized protein n=1 Tax=Irpex rosettiformis TaxID=378272 RepID=A0ACB8U7R9_9APHY|nr:hypothetical protein BDY19DRAFT_939543 [Irpex rosettiformis]